MHWAKVRGRGTTDEAERCFLCGYNGSGAQKAFGAPVCWDPFTGDGKTFKGPLTANLNCPAGILQETVGTAKYTDFIQAYGPCEAKTWGVATNFIPGNNLILVDQRDYVSYGSEMLSVSQPRGFTAFDTNGTAATIDYTVFVRLL